MNTDAFTGAYGTASEIGWEGNYQGVVTCLGGTFYVQDDINRDYGFGIYSGTATTWADAEGYLPAQMTTFRRSGATVSITEFADKLELDGHAYVAVYSRVSVRNSTDRVVVANPDASPGLVLLNTRSRRGKAPCDGRSTTTWWPSTVSETTTRGPALRRWPRRGSFE